MFMVSTEPEKFSASSFCDHLSHANKEITTYQYLCVSRAIVGFLKQRPN